MSGLAIQVLNIIRPLYGGPMHLDSYALIRLCLSSSNLDQTLLGMNALESISYPLIGVILGLQLPLFDALINYMKFD